MSWDEYGKQRRYQYRGRAALGGLAAIVIVVIIVAVVNLLTTSEDARQNRLNDLRTNFATSTTVPAPAPLTEDGNSINAEDLTEDEVERYTSEPITPAELARQYPIAKSGLDAATHEQVRKVAERLVTADHTLQGRSEFPDYWGTQTPTTSPTKRFSIEFSTAFNVTDKPNMVRALVVWRGENWAGVEIDQMRQSVYFSRSGSTLTAIRPDRLPVDVVRRDPFIDGVRFATPEAR